MKLLIRFGLCCFLAPGLFAAHEGSHAGSIMAGAHPRRTQGSMRASGYRGYRGYGGFYWGDSAPFYDYGESQSADPGRSTANPPALPPAVAETAHPVIHEYAQSEEYGIPLEQPNHPVLFLIAFQDKTIRAATTYWVDGGALHYLDTAHQEKEAPLSSVDRALSAQLNSERHVQFNIQ